MKWGSWAGAGGSSWESLESGPWTQRGPQCPERFLCFLKHAASSSSGDLAEFRLYSEPQMEAGGRRDKRVRWEETRAWPR